MDDDIDDSLSRLYNAIRKNDLSETKRLIQETQDILLQSSLNPIFIACMSGSIDVVKYLLTTPELNIEINQEDKDGNTPLLLICANGRIEVIRYILTSPEIHEHAKINHTNHKGFNALFMAAWQNKIEVMDYLLKSPELNEHIDVLHENFDGIDAMMMACCFGKIQAMEYLLNNYDNFSIYKKDKMGKNALTLVCEHFIPHEKDPMIHHLLMEKHMQIDEATQEILKQKGNDEVLSLIKTRDLYMSLNKNLDEKTSKVRQKI